MASVSSLAIRRASGRGGKSPFPLFTRARDSRAGKYRARERERVFTKATEIAACPVTPLASYRRPIGFKIPAIRAGCTRGLFRRPARIPRMPIHEPNERPSAFTRVEKKTK